MSRWIRNNRGFLVFILLFGLFRTAVADWNPIPSGSMRPNLLEGDVVFVNRLAYNLKLPLTNLVLAHTGEPRRGDIVTFFSPANGERLIKRVAALPGDRVEMRDKRLIVNGAEARYVPLRSVTERPAPGVELPALRLEERSADGVHVVQWFERGGFGPHDSFGPLTVPQDQFLMLGDNRDDSADSRWFGLVPRRLLIGRAVLLLASADITGNWMPRFGRFGQSLEQQRP